MVKVSAAKTPRVLVVDDEASVRTFAERALGDAGYSVAAASDGPEALKIAEEQGPFDLFVIDLHMPEMPGDELGRRLRLLNLDARVLYFTGYSDRLFKDKTGLWANEAFIDKPATLKGLREAVSLVLFGHTNGIRP